MGRKDMCVLECKSNGIQSNSQLRLQWSVQKDDNFVPIGGLFASVSQMDNMDFGVSSNSPKPGGNDGNGGFKLPYADLFMKYVSSVMEGVSEEEGAVKNKKRLRLKFKVSNPSLRRLISGAFAGAVSRTAVAPLETIRTHLMFGSSGHSTTEVFHNIIQHDGWPGLFRGNLVNVIRVAPSKAIEVRLKISLQIFFSSFTSSCLFYSMNITS